MENSFILLPVSLFVQVSSEQSDRNSTWACLKTGQNDEMRFTLKKIEQISIEADRVEKWVDSTLTPQQHETHLRDVYDNLNVDEEDINLLAHWRSTGKENNNVVK
jgi:hypothetical protein